MKKVIVAGILIVAVCTAFLVGRLSTSRADIALDSDVYNKPYPVTFGDWVYIYLKARFETMAFGNSEYYVLVSYKGVNNKIRYVIKGRFCDTVIGRKAYPVAGLDIESKVKRMCNLWSLQGYPISLNDFEINIEKKW